MEAFAGKLYEDLGFDRPFKSRDAAFILAFSTIMLNTDLHNPNLPNNRRMKKEEFVRNNSKINAGEDLPLDFLETLYDEIRTRQIQVDMGIADGTGSETVVDYSDTQNWDTLIRKCAQDQAPAAFTPTLAARKSSSSGSLNMYSHTVHERDMFLVMAKPVLTAVLTMWDAVNDDKLSFRMAEGLLDYASTCIHWDLVDMFNGLLQTLVKRVLALLSALSIDASNGTVLSRNQNGLVLSSSAGRKPGRPSAVENGLVLSESGTEQHTKLLLLKYF